MDHIDARPRDPAEAFDEMRGELALLRRAIEGLTAEKEKTPDYSETLGTMDGRLKRIAHNIAFIAERPAMELTPDVIAAQIQDAARSGRDAEAGAIRDARAALEQATARAHQRERTARTVAEQKRFVLQAAGIAAVVALLIGSFLPGAIARGLPERWLVPERMAARVLRLDRWTAGERLLESADAGHWRAIVDAVSTARDNRDVIARCEDTAARIRKPVRCVVTLDRARP